MSRHCTSNYWYVRPLHGISQTTGFLNQDMYVSILLAIHAITIRMFLSYNLNRLPIPVVTLAQAAEACSDGVSNPERADCCNRTFWYRRRWRGVRKRQHFYSSKRRHRVTINNTFIESRVSNRDADEDSSHLWNGALYVHIYIWVFRGSLLSPYSGYSTNQNAEF